MKAAIRIMAAGLAASLALVSCAKQDAMDNGSTSPAGGARTIAVSFANASVKSSLGEDGLTPKFVATDVIKVSNGSATEDCTVEIDGSGNASITTSLTGPLTMVYPAAAWSDTEPYFKVSTEQDGTFASANICKSTIVEGATSASFENQTAIFKLSVPAKDDEKGVDYVVKSLAVKSIGENNIADGSKEITVGDGTSTIAADENGFYYVSLLPGETSSNLYVCAGAGARKLTGDDAIAVNKMYSVALPVLNGHEYVEIGGFKWATMNVGATEVTGENCYGEYFAWGETMGHSLIEDWKSKWIEEDYYYADVFNPNNYSFDWSNAPFNNGESIFDASYFASVKDTECPNGILALKNDAANVNWGGSWRMPTKAEFDALASETKVWDSTNKGYTFGTFPNTIFLPAAGYGGDTDLYDAGDYGSYWSSSLYTDNTYFAYCLYFGGGNASTNSFSRFGGQPVRPVSD